MLWSSVMPFCYGLLVCWPFDWRRPSGWKWSSVMAFWCGLLVWWPSVMVFWLKGLELPRRPYQKATFNQKATKPEGHNRRPPPDQPPPQDQAPLAQCRPPRADTPLEQTPLGADTPPEQTPPRTRHPQTMHPSNQIPLNFPLGCGPGPDPLQFPSWLWAWTRCPSTSPLSVAWRTPPSQTCYKACWDTTCNACWDNPPPPCHLRAVINIFAIVWISIHLAVSLPPKTSEKKYLLI